MRLISSSIRFGIATPFPASTLGASPLPGDEVLEVAENTLLAATVGDVCFPLLSLDVLVGLPLALLTPASATA
jgi:hypothetical protein